MDWLNFILGAATIVSGGGWFLNWKAYRAKTNAEADSAAVSAMKDAIAELRISNDKFQALNDKNLGVIATKDEKIEALNERIGTLREDAATLKMIMCRHDACPFREPLKGQGGEWYEKHRTDETLVDTESIYSIAKRKGYYLRHLPVKPKEVPVTDEKEG